VINDFFPKMVLIEVKVEQFSKSNKVEDVISRIMVKFLNPALDNYLHLYIAALEDEKANGSSWDMRFQLGYLFKEKPLNDVYMFSLINEAVKYISAFADTKVLSLSLVYYNAMEEKIRRVIENSMWN